MRFFTFEWWRSVQGEDWLPCPSKEYEQHLNRLRPHLPPAVLSLADRVLHDARFRGLRTFSKNQRVDLWLNLCTEDGGVEPVVIQFEGVIGLRLLAREDPPLPGEGSLGELGYHEIDVIEDRYEFRALFSSGVEVHVEFTDVAEVPRTD